MGDWVGLSRRARKEFMSFEKHWLKEFAKHPMLLHGALWPVI